MIFSEIQYCAFDIMIRQFNFLNEYFRISSILQIGCETGRFGGNCTNTCDHCKNPANCGIELGECDA